MALAGELLGLRTSEGRGGDRRIQGRALAGLLLAPVQPGWLTARSATTERLAVMRAA
jgi:hypothetical protein